jgi:AAA ATPase domain
MTAPPGRLADVFVGRETELETLSAELGTVRGGLPRVVLIEGPAGIGKTALVDHLLRSESDVRVLRASGDPWEASVPYGVVDQLVRAAGISRAKIHAGRERALPPDGRISIPSGPSCLRCAGWSPTGCWPC